MRKETPLLIIHYIHSTQLKQALARAFRSSREKDRSTSRRRVAGRRVKGFVGLCFPRGARHHRTVETHIRPNAIDRVSASGSREREPERSIATARGGGEQISKP